MVGLDARRVRWSAVPRATGLRVALKWMRGLNERQVKAMGYVSQHGRVTNREYQELCGISRSTAKKELQALVMRGLLQQQGAGRYAHYVLASIGHTQ
ncbi:MAG: helix-turn-helix domain-containing protein [Anaerolineae bacterium]